ncbi:carboxypeptidase regulatory-like domain-containing protein [Cyanobacteria bacterium FACHB-DQ100]|uniref:carboxypeptidase regulatory-like domain-containing protein n=1 Tax=unclassified Leptolyngbya TaxID=2650499 RepID=UPI0016804E03|nr:carboxypeptidase regulatory-like domain-containing protein [Leptolyngbya sp. FACHB-17]MBD1823555.1 carboxypeptidase regulatory-like domain-containing protein [Cyanobacteria bacterium FACHB-DQ100]
MKLQPTQHQVAIAGIVSDAETGELISGAEVKLGQVSTAFNHWLALKALPFEHVLNRDGRIQLNPTLTLVQEQDALLLVTYTALDGHYYFIDLPDGIYSLQVALPHLGTRYGTRQVENLNVTSEAAIANLSLPPTGIKGRILDSEQKPVAMAKVQIEGNAVAVFSDRNGDYGLTGLEVWRRDRASQSARPLVTVSAQGYQSATSGVWLSVGEMKSLDLTLTRK